jgi:uncharacterized membrane protein
MDTHPAVSVGTRWLLGLPVVALAATAVLGLVTLWPTQGPTWQSGTTIRGTVVARNELPCEDTAPAAGIRCVRPEVQLASGGRVALQEQSASDATVDVGDDVLVRRDASGFQLAGRPRDRSLLVALAVAAVALALVTRTKGLRSLAGLAVAALVLAGFAVPALASGGSPLGVGATAAATTAFALVALVHGVSARSAVVVLGTGAGIGAATLAAQWAGAESVLPGPVTAGLIVAATGALLEVAVATADATWDLRATDAGAGWRGVTAAGVRGAGRRLTEVATTVTLVAAGAVLPLLVGPVALLDGLRTEDATAHLLRALAPVLALGVTVPLTAGLAALVAVREGGGTRPGDPRRFRSRHERRMWAGGAPPPDRA